MNKCIFTIVAKNYIGLGQILEQSVRNHHNDIDFYIFVADEFAVMPDNLNSNIIIAKRRSTYRKQ